MYAELTNDLSGEILVDCDSHILASNIVDLPLSALPQLQ